MNTSAIAYFAEQRCLPLDPAENVRWRLAMREKAASDPGLQRLLLETCAEDVHFFVNGVCWIHAPHEKVRFLPFITRPHQDRALRQLNAVGGIRDFAFKKSRCEGVTWLYLDWTLHRWLFDSQFGCGLVSRNEYCVDSPDDPDSLMSKLDWQIGFLPPWMMNKDWFRRSIQRHSLKNLERDNSIVAYPATGDQGSGGRKTVFFFDEFAKFKRGEDHLAWESVLGVTHSRGAISTFWGESGTYYDLVTADHSELEIITVVWWENPAKNHLLYRWYPRGGEAVNPGEQRLLERYLEKHASRLQRLRAGGFMQDGQFRSPWYDAECARPNVTPQTMAQEHDCDPTRSKGKVFAPAVIRRLRGQANQVQRRVGELLFDPQTLEPEKFVESEAGHLTVFLPIGADGKPPRGQYVLGADVALGHGGDYSSNSALEGMDVTTGEHACEYVNAVITGAELADYAVALCKWLYDALLNWEVSGPGGAFFSKRMADGIWWNCYHHKLDTGKRRKEPGYHCKSQEDKLAWLQRFGVAMAQGDFVPRSLFLLAECGQFEVENGKVIHGRAKRSGLAGLPHGDAVIGGSMMWMAASQGYRGTPRPKRGAKSEAEIPWEKVLDPRKIPANSYAGRRLAERAAARARDGDEEFDPPWRMVY